MTQAYCSTTTAVVGAALTFGTITTSWCIYRSFIRKVKCPNEETSDDPVKQGFSLKRIPQNLDAIIIGSGIGGLATAAILAKDGKRVLVLEQHDIAGGNLHTFVEKGYEFDTGLHYIGGKIGQQGSSCRKLLNYITDEQVKWERMDDAYDVAIKGNERYHFYSSWTRLKKELKTSFPDEAKAIDKYFRTVHYAAECLFPLHMTLKCFFPEAVYKLGMWLFDRQSLFRKTTSEVLESITSNSKFRGVLSYHYGDYGETPDRGLFAMNALIASHYRSGAYYPVGGPLKISEEIVKLIEKWGGKVMVRARVDTILIDDNNIAYGVAVGGKVLLAETIVSSVGVPTTFTKLIPENQQHVVSRQIGILKDPKVASNVSLMSMFVGINDPDGTVKLPKSNYWIHPSWDHKKNMEEFRKDRTKVSAFFLSFSSAKDPSYSSRNPGKHVALVIGPCCYDDVEQFKDERVKRRSEDYISMKEKWQQIFMQVLLDQFPELEDRIDFVDFGTAITNDYYLGTHRGAVYGLAHTPERFRQHWLRPKTPIKNLFLTGQDVASCGVMGALVGGYMSAYTISKRAMFRTGLLWV